MTEIDFIPQWYRAGRKQKLWHKRQYLILAIAVSFIALGCFAAGHSLSAARAELGTMRSNLESGIQAIQQYGQLQARWDELNSKATLFHTVRPRTPYASILAEISACIGPNVVLSKLTLQNTPINTISKTAAAAASSMIRLGDENAAGKTSDESVPTQTEVVLQGIAGDGAVVAGLIAALEQSDYFQRVIPGYSKTIKIRDYDVTEFEIRCVVADFELIQ
ncbi:MAG: hypothetical protein ABFD91_14995 [Anaerohalosphaeraceae bacterium]